MYIYFSFQISDLYIPALRGFRLKSGHVQLFNRLFHVSWLLVVLHLTDGHSEVYQSECQNKRETE